jgi:8-oxo-dGTP pyrophosphatase MutT (NUDIX family)
LGYISELREQIGSRPIIMVGACVIVVQDDSILLEKRADNGMWGLPGGSLEPGEAMEQVARRELFEETGLQAKALELLDIFSGPELYYKYPHGDEVFNVVAAYICKEFEGVAIIDKFEVDEIQFFNCSSLPNNINPPDQPILNAYFIKEMRNLNDRT